MLQGASPCLPKTSSGQYAGPSRHFLKQVKEIFCSALGIEFASECDGGRGDVVIDGPLDEKPSLVLQFWTLLVDTPKQSKHFSAPTLMEGFLVRPLNPSSPVCE